MLEGGPRRGSPPLSEAREREAGGAPSWGLWGSLGGNTVETHQTIVGETIKTGEVETEDTIEKYKTR